MLTRIALAITGVMAFLGLLIVGKALMAPPPQAPQVTAATETPVHKKNILALHNAMLAGSFLKATDLTPVDIPDAYVPQGAVEDTPANRQALEGALLRMDVPANGTLVEQSLIRAGDHGFLAAVLKPGMRAVSIGVDAVSGVSGLIESGDRVDVVMTERIGAIQSSTANADNTDNTEKSVSKIVLSGVRVVAVGGALAPHSTVQKETANLDSRAVTLEVTPEQTGIVSVAQQLGQVTLAVQSLGGEHNDLPTPPVWGHTVSAANTQPQGSSTKVVHVYNGIAGVQDAHF